MKILAVEDDPVSAIVLRKTLEKLGHTVVMASNGAEAWERLKQEKFRLVISDWMMPEMDGLELCRRIRYRIDAPYIYCILLTAKGMREDRLAGLRAGADDFLVKPLDKDEMIARLEVAERILKMQEKLAELVKYLEIANRRFCELYMSVPVACITYDCTFRIQEWNRSAEAVFGYAAETVVQKTCWQTVVAPGDRVDIQRIAEQVLAGNRFENLEWAYDHPDGTLRYLLCNAFPLCGPQGEIIGAISTCVDISERIRLEQQVGRQLEATRELYGILEEKSRELAQANTLLAERATTDGLTGLANRRHFAELLESHSSLALRHDHALSVLMLDVDEFKEYNDSYGHLAGDNALIQLAQLLRSHVRQGDIVARYGGEEFTLLLPETDEAGSREIAMQVRAVIENYAWSLRPITVSIGIGTMRPGMSDSYELVDEADRALYCSKKQGRNRVTHFLDIQDDSASKAA